MSTNSSLDHFSNKLTVNFLSDFVAKDVCNFLLCVNTLHNSHIFFSFTSDLNTKFTRFSSNGSFKEFEASFRHITTDCPVFSIGSISTITDHSIGVSTIFWNIILTEEILHVITSLRIWINRIFTKVITHSNAKFTRDKTISIGISIKSSLILCSSDWTFAKWIWFIVELITNLGFTSVSSIYSKVTNFLAFHISATSKASITSTVSKCHTDWSLHWLNTNKFMGKKLWENTTNHWNYNRWNTSITHCISIRLTWISRTKGIKSTSTSWF